MGVIWCLNLACKVIWAYRFESYDKVLFFYAPMVKLVNTADSKSVAELSRLVGSNPTRGTWDTEIILDKYPNQNTRK